MPTKKQIDNILDALVSLDKANGELDEYQQGVDDTIRWIYHDGDLPEIVEGFSQSPDLQ